MSNQIVAIIVCSLVFSSVLVSCYASTVAPLCQPGIIEGMPPHIRKVCMALENSDQLTTALKTYINNEAATLVTNSEDYTNNLGKRTDVDHVFLRFGKRR
ncbi:dromyosuppressin-like [Musca domestica]|uniref:Dromyosuppressin n=2 Tax=Musca TaxID=7369 RepID=A0A1I8MJI4_MUSDO|nr:dromyosuppressin [Musca domestica]XP_058986482.1 dromyosuppressin-like [Musca domestica]XP_061398576.1 dromyosuppressin-like [Musca vetustissima]